MKKLISIIAASALVFTLAFPVLAAESPSANSDLASSPDANLTVTASVLSEAEESTIHNAAQTAAGDEEYRLDAINVEAPAGYFDTHDTLTINFVRSYASDVIAVLYWNAGTNSWDSAPFTVEGNTITGNFLHTCNIVFVIKVAAPNTEIISNDADAVSPQTGSTASAYASLAAALTAGAAVCFCVAKKIKVSAD